jgi:mevalonate kinase
LKDKINVSMRTPGKLIILGEYAVLEGGFCLVTATNRYANAIFKNSKDGYFAIQAPAIKVPMLKFFLDETGRVKFIGKPIREVIEKTSFFSAIFEYAVRKLLDRGIKIPPLEIFLDTFDFFYTQNLIKLGLGSSAALTVALVSGLLSANVIDPEQLSPEFLIQLAMDSHNNAQGVKGSGADIVTSIYGGTLKYQIKDKEIKFKQIEFPKDLFYSCVWSGVPSSTKGFVEKFNKYKKEHSSDFKNAIEEMISIANTGIEYFENDNISEFLRYYDQYFKELLKMNGQMNIPVISDAHSSIYKIARNSGAYYKSSGAGGGDLGIVFSDDPSIIKIVNNNLKENGFDILDLKFSSEGVKNFTAQGGLNEELAYT